MEPSAVLLSNMKEYLQEGASEEVLLRYAGLPSRAEQADFGELENVVIIDTETTGVSFQKDELTQIAAARLEKGKVVGRFSTFVNPGKSIPEDIVHLTKISDEDVAQAPSPNEALEQLVEFVGSTPLVAHNTAFDRHFVTNHPGGYALLDNLWIDSLELSRIAVPFLKSHRLVDLAKTFDVPLSTHRADADVETTSYVYKILLAAVETMSDALLELISRLSSEQEWPTVHVFKHFAARADESVRKASTAYLLRSLRERQSKEAASLAKTSCGDSEEVLDLEFPSAEEVKEAFSQEGVLGYLYDDYEPRSEQRQMAVFANTSFAHSVNVAIEAGTGVGKSIAYLLPLSLIARRNRICVGVATKTNALLDQLTYHELPRLSEALIEAGKIDSPLRYASLKGFSHYLCMYKVQHLAEKGAELREVGRDLLTNAPAIAAILSFAEQAGYEDMDMLKTDWRLVPKASVSSASRECLKSRCPYYGGRCFVNGARKRAENVDILLTNHSLMLCDLSVDRGLLPNILYWAVDEAHNIESEARKTFSIAISCEESLQCARRLASAEPSQNPLIRIDRLLSKQTTLFDGRELAWALLRKAQEASVDCLEAAEEFCKSMKGLLFFAEEGKGRAYENVDLWVNDDIRSSNTFEDLKKKAEHLRDVSRRIVKANQELVACMEDQPSCMEPLRDLSLLTYSFQEQADSLDALFFKLSGDFVYAATLNRKKDRFKDSFEAFPLELGPQLNEKLFEHTHSVLFTSATLSMGGDFSSFEKALGLNASEGSACNFKELESSFDYDQNMTIYVAKDMPEIGMSSYLGSLQRFLTDLHLAQQGSMLTLFTNKREMEQCFDVVQPALREAGLRLVCQKWGVSVKGLRDDFNEDKALSLFALKSFWEGFDAPGDTLRGVVVPKLPFAKPSDPLSLERAQKDPQAWYHYVLPAAVIEMKQAAGRLIRKADDKGILVLADSRLVSKRYGKKFLDSMPSKTIKVMTMAQIIEDISRSHG